MHLPKHKVTLHVRETSLHNLQFSGKYLHKTCTNFCVYMTTHFQMMNWVKIRTSFLDTHTNLVHNFQIHDSVESLKKRVDPKVLPKELGGSMPMAEMIGKLFSNINININ